MKLFNISRAAKRDIDTTIPFNDLFFLSRNERINFMPFTLPVPSDIVFHRPPRAWEMILTIY
jgi:hypothetical protein